MLPNQHNVNNKPIYTLARSYQLVDSWFLRGRGSLHVVAFTGIQSNVRWKAYITVFEGRGSLHVVAFMKSQ